MFQCLDKVEVEMQTCEDPRPPNGQSPIALASGQRSVPGSLTEEDGWVGGGQMDGCMDGQMYGCMDGQMDRWMVLLCSPGWFQT